MMKKIASLLFGFCLMLSLSFAVCAQTADNNGGSAKIAAAVPYTHTITINADGAQVFYNGVGGGSITVDRLSEPALLIRAESGRKITKVAMNGEDITDKIKGGYYTLTPVYEDKVLNVTTENEPEQHGRTYTVKGVLTHKGQPLEDVTLELRSTLKTNITDEDGEFEFTQVEAGKHSLTAIKDGKIIGYMEFVLNGSFEMNFEVSEDGVYNIAADDDETGVDMSLNLNDDGTLSVDKINGVEVPTQPPTDVTGSTDSTDVTDATDATDATEVSDSTGTTDETVTSIANEPTSEVTSGTGAGSLISPKTGIEGNAMLSLWIVMIAISLIGITLTLSLGKKKKS